MASPGNLNDQDPYAVNDIPLVTIEINGKSYTNVKDYSYDTDILTLGDPFCLTLSNVDGQYSSDPNIVIGAPVKLYISSPSVAGGSKVPKLTGVITEIEKVSDHHAGTQIMIKGADLGWHLSNNTGQVFMRLRNITINTFLQKALEPSWNFSGVRLENDTNFKLKIGAIAQRNIELAPAQAIHPLIQIEPGQTIADVLIPYCRRERLLVNVSADGYLQLFRPKPSSKEKARYTIHFHKANESQRVYNNVLSARHVQKLEHVFTHVTCVGQVVTPIKTSTVDNPNEGRLRGSYTNYPPLPPSPQLGFIHRLSFPDGEMCTSKAVTNRASWKWGRELFDSFVMEYTVKGHSQFGTYYETDTFVDVNDSVNNVTGKYYVSAVRYNRTIQNGTTTTLTLRYPDLLGA